MVYEGDFVRSFIPPGVDTSPAGSFFDFPGPNAGSAAVVGGDLAVAFADSGAARRMMRFLASPAAAEPWAREGGFLSPNHAVGPSVYPDAVARRAAARLSSARTVRFDLSDLQPPAFGATAGQGMWHTFRELVRHPDTVDAVATRLEAGAVAAFACERALKGSC